MTQTQTTPASLGETAPRTWTELKPTKKASVPEGLWMRCPGCAAMIYRRQVEACMNVCPECGHHFRISARQRLEQLLDTGTFTRLFEGIETTDPLGFEDLKKYPDRIEAEKSKSGVDEAVLAGEGFVKGRPIVLSCLDLTFMMGSMGSVVGEVLTRSIEHATETSQPLVIVSCSGGARMQEAALSLMQMAKTSAALARFDDAGGLFISVLTDPTTGGVTASFAMLGDVILAEPNALIGFAGPRVIKQTIRQDLPPGFQRSEFLKRKGLVDRVVKRSELRDEIARLIDYTGS